MDIQTKVNDWVMKKERELQDTTKFIAGYGNLKPVDTFEWNELKAIKWAITLSEAGNRERLMSFENSVFLRAGWTLEIWVDDQNSDERYQQFWMGLIPDVKLFVSSWFQNRVAELNTKHEFLSTMIARWGEVKCENEEVRALLSAESNGDEMLHFENLYLNTTPFPIQKYQKFFKGYPDENPRSHQTGEPSSTSSEQQGIAKVEVETDEAIASFESMVVSDSDQIQPEDSSNKPEGEIAETSIAGAREAIGLTNLANSTGCNDGESDGKVLVGANLVVFDTEPMDPSDQAAGDGKTETDEFHGKVLAGGNLVVSKTDSMDLPDHDDEEASTDLQAAGDGKADVFREFAEISIAEAKEAIGGTSSANSTGCIAGGSDGEVLVGADSVVGDTEPINPPDQAAGDGKTEADIPKTISKAAEKNRRKREAQKLKKQALQAAKDSDFMLMNQAKAQTATSTVSEKKSISLSMIVAKFQESNKGISIADVQKRAREFVQARIRKLERKEKNSDAYRFFKSIENVAFDKQASLELAALSMELGLPHYHDLQNEFIADFVETTKEIEEASSWVRTKSTRMNDLTAQMNEVDEQRRVVMTDMRNIILAQFLDFVDEEDRPPAYFQRQRVLICNVRYAHLKEVVESGNKKLAASATMLMECYEKILVGNLTTEMLRMLAFMYEKIREDDYLTEECFLPYLVERMEAHERNAQE